MPDTQLTAIVDRIVVILQSVTNAGQVYNRLRFTDNLPDFNTRFQNATTSDYRFWEVRRLASAEAYVDVNNRTIRTYTIQLDGFKGLRDANDSEGTFQALVESVCDAFRGNTVLRNSASADNAYAAISGLMDAGLLQVNRVEEVARGQVKLLHHVEATISVRERVTF